jgi:hypothetical protein
MHKMERLGYCLTTCLGILSYGIYCLKKSFPAAHKSTIRSLPCRPRMQSSKYFLLRSTYIYIHTTLTLLVQLTVAFTKILFLVDTVVLKNVLCTYATGYLQRTWGSMLQQPFPFESIKSCFQGNADERVLPYLPYAAA